MRKNFKPPKHVVIIAQHLLAMAREIDEDKCPEERQFSEYWTAIEGKYDLNIFEPGFMSMEKDYEATIYPTKSQGPGKPRAMDMDRYFTVPPLPKTRKEQR